MDFTGQIWTRQVVLEVSTRTSRRSVSRLSLTKNDRGSGPQDSVTLDKVHYSKYEIHLHWRYKIKFLAVPVLMYLLVSPCVFCSWKREVSISILSVHCPWYPSMDLTGLVSPIVFCLGQVAHKPLSLEMISLHLVLVTCCVCVCLQTEVLCTSGIGTSGNRILGQDCRLVFR